MTARTLLLPILLLAMLTGCFSRKPPTATVPAINGAPVALGAEPSSAPESEPEPVEPALGAERVVVPPLMPGEVARTDPETHAEPQPNSTSEPAKSRRRPPAGVAARPPDAELPTDPEPARTEQRPPSLKPMMSEAERRQLDQQMQGHLERARRNLAGIQESRLADNERSVLQEARSFLARAEQLGQTDLTLANSLAERAAILTQELLRKQR
ncbi:MAG: hypothetical protein KIT83_19960 [Bryobacterales bacterium]|nr:hypothetical protein [Bryobacterales bacterium]